MNFEVIGQAVENAKIKVVGVGGAGGNAVIHMINHNIEGVDFICANTDTQALSMADGAISLKLGNGLTKGLGAGANPDVGRKAAERVLSRLGAKTLKTRVCPVLFSPEMSASIISNFLSAIVVQLSIKNLVS